MKRWKQVTSCCLAAALAAGSPILAAYGASPEFARSEEEWSRLRDNAMEYDELADLIHEYNATVQNNELDIIKKKNDDDITSDDIAQSLRDQAADLRATISGDAGSEFSDATAEANARSLERQADENVTDLEIYRLSYQQTEANLAVAARSDMISYHQKLLQAQLDAKNRELLQELYNVAVAQKAAGTGTQMEVLTALENIQTLDGAIQQNQADIDNLRQTLCVLLGWTYNASPEIEKIPAADMNRIAGMNPEADLEKALENNYDLKINKRKLENATAELTRQSYRNTIRDNEQKIGSSLVTNYQGVLLAKVAYDQAVADLNLEARNMSDAEIKYRMGNIPRINYLQQQYTYFSKQIAVQQADINLFKAMETYDWSVNGLAATQ